MSVNPAVGENEVQGIFAEFWPVKPEPGSVADQLLTKGRLEGRQEGRQEGEIKGEIKLIRTLESILGIEPTEPDLSNKTLEELRSISEALQDRIQRRG
jgi:predicted transposase YdaD